MVGVGLVFFQQVSLQQNALLIHGANDGALLIHGANGGAHSPSQ